MGSIRLHSRFQLEASKLGRSVVFQVTVYERKERNKRRLYAETQCYDALQHMIQFIIRDASDVGGVIERFRGQLEHRGFTPICYRTREGEGPWSSWQDLLADVN